MDGDWPVGFGHRARIPLPNWTPAAVAARVHVMETPLLPSKHWYILVRLATDPEMEKVWAELGRRKRPTESDEGGGFLFPAKRDDGISLEDAQYQAFAELLHLAFCAARDEFAVSKPEEVEAAKAKPLAKASTLRGCAEELIERNPDQKLARDDAAALRRVADWYEKGAAALRPADDPASIRNDRGDRVVRGVSTVIGQFLLAKFGHRFDRTAARIAGVALGRPASPRAVRSAFSDQNPS